MQNESFQVPDLEHFKKISWKFCKSLLCCVFIKCIQFKKDNSSHLQWPTLHTQPTANWQQTRRRDNTVYRR